MQAEDLTLSPLQIEITKRIRRGGPISFAEFMNIALYHPTLGYYASRVPGPRADYRTSPSLTASFGRLMAKMLHRMWELLGEPEVFTVIEVGGGAGDLALAAARALPEPLRKAITWRFVERFEKVRAIQAERLKGEAVRAEWSGEVGEAPPAAGCVVANEVLDNFPVQVFEVIDGQPVELLVGVEGDRLVETRSERPLSVRPDPAHSELAEYARVAAAHLEDGDRFEVRPGVEEWCRRADAALERGYLVVIDYGDTTPDLWIKRPAGTMVTYKDENIGLDPFDCPGERDITAHVDFTSLERAASASGFVAQPIVTQREFLEELGIADIGRGLRWAQQEAQSAGNHVDAMQLLAERGRLQALTARGGLGDLLVFVAKKNAPPLSLKVELSQQQPPIPASGASASTL